MRANRFDGVSFGYIVMRLCYCFECKSPCQNIQIVKWAGLLLSYCAFNLWTILCYCKISRRDLFGSISSCFRLSSTAIEGLKIVVLFNISSTSVVVTWNELYHNCFLFWISNLEQAEFALTFASTTVSLMLICQWIQLFSLWLTSHWWLRREPGLPFPKTMNHFAHMPVDSCSFPRWFQ